MTVVWGLNGLRSVRDCRVCVIVDVLSFSTAVVAACSNGALVFPYRWRDGGADRFAASVGAELAVRREDGLGCGAAGQRPSLSPVSLATLPSGFRLVLPSPNGSTLATEAEAEADSILAGCLRNASAVAAWLNRQEHDVAVVAAGERWPDGSLRVALEDLLGAGAIVAGWLGTRCADAVAAETVFHRFRDELEATLRSTVSGKELAGRGFEADVTFAARLDVSAVVPVLVDGAFRPFNLPFRGADPTTAAR